MERREFLLTLAAGLAVAATARGAVTGTRAGETTPAPAAAPAPPSPAAATAPLAPAALPPPTGVVTALPGEGNGLALTIDDGTNSEVVAAFAALAVDADVRLTFFPNGRYRSWEDNAAVLRPLAESGQIAFGNHTWSHPDLTRLTDAEVAEEITRNRDFLRRTLGVRETPFFRPPFGARDERTDRIAADCGHPTIAMWNGTLGDSRVLTGPELVGYAREWFAAQTIVVGHANHRTVTTVYGELLDLIRERGLRTVTLADAWAPPPPLFQGVVATGRVPR
ncbi:polysaccharide deacetylase family protein [Candidatus Blastococcus massiliensis]|uniref:polysaccharide deacetylase family protein n=1 Tax=Candidatus Blastococcus massiliensis TaxID=1470358 RepID=UPI0004AD5628|nr:polysaccharide deacetylase family protein [Candidatus Blastococcus massiliensis]